MLVGHKEFIRRLGSEFPEVVSQFDRSEKGLLHPEMGAFRRIVEEAIDDGRLWAAEKYFRFVDQVLVEADADVRNAIEVSFLEDFALGGFTRARYEAVKCRMPRNLREALIRSSEQWR